MKKILLLALMCLVFSCQPQSSSSDDSAPIGGGPGQPPAAPTDLVFDVVVCHGSGAGWMDATFLWSWNDNSTDEQGFVLNWVEVGGSDGIVSSGPDDPTAEHRVHLDSNSMIVYSVIAFNGNGMSDPSSEVVLELNTPGVSCP